MSQTEKNNESLSEKLDWRKYINYNNIVGNLPFILFLSLIAIVYIFNGHFSDKLVRKISNSERNMKELEYEYKTLKSEVIFRSKPTEMMKAVAPMGLKELKQPPQVIIDSGMVAGN